MGEDGEARKWEGNSRGGIKGGGRKRRIQREEWEGGGGSQTKDNLKSFIQRKQR